MNKDKIKTTWLCRVCRREFTTKPDKCSWCGDTKFYENEYDGLKTYHIDIGVKEASGFQTFSIRAKSTKDAFEKYKKDFGKFEFVCEEVEVGSLEEAQSEDEFYEN